MVDPNKSFKDARRPLIEVRDDGMVYYMIRCSVCGYERYVAAITWNAGPKMAQCATDGCYQPNFKRM
jgi:hypothetical protein